MKVFLLCETKIDYLEIWEYVIIHGVFSSRALAEKKAQQLELDEYVILPKKVDK